MKRRRPNKHGLPLDEYRKRNREFCLRGTDLPQSKLNPEKVRQIRAAAETTSQRELARRYDVNLSTIQKVLNYTTWVHVL